MTRERLSRICQAAPPITVAAMTAANGCANITGSDQAFGAAQIATATLIAALTVIQARETP
jgi:hypothetical protein